ncbi:MAG TPA: THUMP domain-containing protein [Candidatus Nanoarchaeia archaeon]|nr:THUMP domain-containing protein [Candidatus Nanoarchaeia archaeon]
MRIFVIVNSGLEKLAEQEIKELVKAKAKISGSVLDFEIKDEKELFYLMEHLQSARRALIACGDNLEKWDQFEFKDYISPESTFKVEVENLKGQENRFKIAKEVAGKIYIELAKNKINPKLELKRPEVLVIVYVQEEKYFLGIDFFGQEINSRAYRVFPHSASFKGDLAYFFVRKSGFKPGKKLLVGLAKDGTMAIEAALFANKISFLDKDKIAKKKYSFFKFPKWGGMDLSGFGSLKTKPLSQARANKVFAFDTNMQTIVAAKKNAQIAKVKEYLELQKYSLEDLDVKYSEKEFDHLIFQVTSKDEDSLNEIYYQSSYVLKPKGTLLLIGRGGWQLTISEKFKLLEEAEIRRGESSYHYWLMERK